MNWQIFKRMCWNNSELIYLVLRITLPQVFVFGCLFYQEVQITMYLFGLAAGLAVTMIEWLSRMAFYRIHHEWTIARSQIPKEME